MTTHEPCLDPEVLAALVEGRLTAPERQAAERHLSDCLDCREIVADLVRERPATAPRAAIYWGQDRWRALAAAAAVILLAGAAYTWWNTPERRATAALARLADASQGERPVLARLHEGVRWAPPPTTTRGNEEAAASLDVEEALVTLRRLATTSPSARTIAAAAVATLIAGDVDEAIAGLESAAGLADADARVWADLSGARLERWRRFREAADAAAALDASERALLLTPADPVARFNQALAVEALGLRDQAIARWRAYLEVDETSPWAAEAREHLARIEGSGAPSASAPEPPSPALAGLTPPRRQCAEQAHALLLTSRADFNASRLAEAEAAARQAVDRFRCAGLSPADAEAQWARTRFFQGQTEEGVATAGRLLESGTPLWAVSRGHMEYIRALDHLRKGRYSESDAGYGRALLAFREAGDREFEAATIVLRSEVARNRSDQVGAWAPIPDAFAVLPLLGPRRTVLAFHNAIATAEWFDQPGAARFLADVLVDICLAQGDPLLAVAAYLRSAAARLALGRPAEARDLLARAESLAPSIADRSLRDQYATEVAVMTTRALAEVDPVAAMQAFNRILDDFSPAERPLRRASALLGRGRLHARAGDMAAAERDWLAGATLFEDPRPEMRDEQWRVDSRSELWGLFGELIRVREADPIAALEVAERSRGRALLDARARGAAVVPLAGDALYRWLPDDVTVVAYAVTGDDVLRRWTVTRQGVRLDRVPVSAVDLTTEVDAFVREVTANRLDSGVNLSRLLIPDTVSQARTPRLVFVPDGVLTRVPFAALPLPGGARLVVDDFEVQVAPSLTVLREAGRRGQSPSRALLVAAGDPHPGEGLFALPGVTAELTALRDLRPDARVLAGNAATADAFIEELPKADLVHFAGHVVADASVPSRSRLLLSPQAPRATVTFSDLRGVALRPGATVILSACEGARGRVFTGEGAVGLPFVFLANGASSVVAALWKVDDAAPAAFWIDVHQHLGDGAAPASALAVAQRRGRASGMSAAVWAAFTVVGGLVQA